MISEGEKAYALKTALKKGEEPTKNPETRNFVNWVLGDIKTAAPSIDLDVGTRIPITLEIEFRQMPRLR